MTLRKTYMKLALAILFEIFATTMLVLSEGFDSHLSFDFYP